MKSLSAAVFFLAGAAAAAAETMPCLVTADGKTYQRVRVTAVEPDGLRITHAEGAAKVGFEQLSAEQQKEYGFDAASATAFRQAQQKELEAARTARLQAQMALQQDREAAAFKLFRQRIMETILTWNFELAQMESLLEQWIAAYRKAGREQWVAALEKDRDFLREHEKERPLWELSRRTRALEEENLRLAREVDALQANQRQPIQIREIISSADQPYWYSSYPLSWVNPVPCLTPPVRPLPCPTPAPVQDLTPSPAFVMPSPARRTIRSHSLMGSSGIHAAGFSQSRTPAAAVAPLPASPSAGRTFRQPGGGLVPSAAARTLNGAVPPGVRNGR
ncbi:MAG: hypothetical protein KA004_05520 [Verrucomicrobiales bacterium]|nr:hypothetical protein [Verrucomicrobiales bacterium]